MDILFKNKYARNKEIVKELYRYQYFQRGFFMFFNTLICLSVLANIVIILLGVLSAISNLILGLLLLFYPVFCYFTQVKMLLKRDKEIFGKEPEIEVIITDEYMKDANNEKTAPIEFDKIKVVKQTKNLILIRTKARLIYILPKDTFTVGSKDEFIDFLRKKGVVVKGK